MNQTRFVARNRLKASLTKRHVTFTLPLQTLKNGKFLNEVRFYVALDTSTSALSALLSNS